MEEQTEKLDTLIFKLEKLFFVANSLSNHVDLPESYSLAFYTLLDEIQGVENIYQHLETSLDDLA